MSSVHKTPPLRVSRPVSACARCRSAKIRCDGKLPACTACERAGRAGDCSSGSDQFARGKERSYVASLETKIERLERQLHYRKHVEQHSVGLETRERISADRVEPRLSKKAEASDVDELVSDFGYLAVNATSNGFRGFDKEMSLTRLVLSIAIIEDLPDVREFPLPPRAIALDLLQTCVSDFLTLCPVMSFAAAGGALERVYHHSQRLASPNDIWNVRLMLALGLCARSKSKSDHRFQSAIRHVSLAIRTVGEIIISPGSLDRLQSLLLLVLFSMSSPQYFNSWYLTGMAARFMAEMGLHKIAGQSENIKPPHMEKRRQLFHLVYVVDRFVSISRLRPFCFSDDSADLELPSFLTPNDIRVGQNYLDQKSVDLAKQFASLIQCQSFWYHQAIFASQTSHPRPWTEKLNGYHDNMSWVSRLETSITGPLRSRFLTQIYYLAVLILLPYPDQLINLTSYAKAVALENIVDFVEALSGLVDLKEPSGHCRIDDYLQGFAIGDRLLSICRDSASALYVTPTITNEEASQMIPLPVLLWTGEGGIFQKVVNSIHKLDSLLVLLSERFDQRAMYGRWKINSEGVLQSLNSLSI